jgi:DNA-binding response OmpR family regulator
MCAARQILIVEHNRAQQKILNEGLGTDSEFEVPVAESFTDVDALLLAEDAWFHSVVLDLETLG